MQYMDSPTSTLFNSLGELQKSTVYLVDSFLETVNCWTLQMLSSLFNLNFSVFQ